MSDGSVAHNDDYAAGVEALNELVAALPLDPPVVPGRMFNGDGVRVRGRFFAFIGRNGDLLAKIPAARVEELVAGQTGARVVMGSRTMREWARIPATTGSETWRQVLAEAYTFVSAGAPR
jgi:hypothetical protein